MLRLGVSDRLHDAGIVDELLGNGTLVSGRVPLHDGAHAGDEEEVHAVLGGAGEVDEVPHAGDVGAGEGGEVFIEVDGLGVVDDVCCVADEVCVCALPDAEIWEREVDFQECDFRGVENGGESPNFVDARLALLPIFGAIETVDVGDGIGRHQGGEDIGPKTAGCACDDGLAGV